MYQYKTIEEYAEKLKSTQYMSWIDLWRGFAIILVTMFHCGVQKSLGLGVFPVDFFDNIWFNIALPPFIFLSGYAMLINYPQVNDYKMYLKKKLKYIIPNYLIWGSAISIFYRFWQLSNFYQITNLIDIFYLILFSLLSLFTGNVWGLYFIFVLIQFYIFYPLLLKIINKFRKPLLFFLFYFLFLLILSLISTYSVDLLSISELTFSIQFNNTYEMKLNYLGFLFISKQFLDYLSFFIFGIICAKYKKVISKLNYYKLIIILLIPIYIQFYLIVYFDIFGGYFTWIIDTMNINLAIFILLLFFSNITLPLDSIFKKQKDENNKINLKSKSLSTGFIKNKIKRTLWKLGIHSGGMYYIQFFILFFIQYLTKFLIYNLNIALSYYYLLSVSTLSSILVIVISYLLINFIRKNVKRSRYIIGI
jgi:hypothetical protein